LEELQEDAAGAEVAIAQSIPAAPSRQACLDALANRLRLAAILKRRQGRGIDGSSGRRA